MLVVWEVEHDGVGHSVMGRMAVGHSVVGLRAAEYSVVGPAAVS